MCRVLGGPNAALMARNYRKQKLLDQKPSLQPQIREAFPMIKRPFKSVVEQGYYEERGCDCNISTLQLMKCQPIVIMFYGSRGTESCD